jgi:SPP1 family phage portal protein
MNKLRTDKDVLTPDDIIKYIEDYEHSTVPFYDRLWQYYLGKNTTILDKRSPDPNNPDNRTPVSYGRKIITTFTGYAYRPRYITYKSENEAFLNELTITFNENNEHIKTSLNGRNTGIFGLSYELLYIDTSKFTKKPEVKFAIIDPRQMIAIYNYELDDEIVCAIRFYPMDDENWKVSVFYADKTVNYDMKRDKWKHSSTLSLTSEEPNFFGEVPVIAYYLGQEMQGIIEPVLPLIDDYDNLISGSIIEFDRYANAYLRLVGMSLTDQNKSASPGVFKSALALLKYRRVFEQLKSKDDVTFLTKDIPSDYIRFMTELIKEQIHTQSHVPDLGSSAFKDGVSGVAIQRLMFDFENVVSNAEAEFDTGLLNRIRLITNFYKINNRADGTFDEITISHKRNAPLNLKEYADTSLTMSQAGLSRESIVEIWPDDVFPDVDEELKRQDADREMAMPDVDTISEEPEVEDGDN